ncbi:MAG: hypothetical protein K2J60_18675, partial [Acetatifactor sp.]|nr:hypothetical protein [Acetatifactor sp.]
MQIIIVVGIANNIAAGIMGIDAITIPQMVVARHPVISRIKSPAPMKAPFFRSRLSYSRTFINFVHPLSMMNISC